MHTPFRKQFAAELAVTPGERAVVARISTTDVDRDGEVLLSQGCDASDFLKSPTVFFNHDYDLPIGKCTAIQRLPDRLEAKTVFAQRPADYVGPWLPDAVLALFQQGVINGFSVGFAPIESRQPTKRDRELFGEQVRRVYSKWKLLEYSVAPLPANQDALALAVSKGLVSTEIVARLLPGTKVEPPRRKLLIVLATTSGSSPAKRTMAERVDRAILKASGRIYV